MRFTRNPIDEPRERVLALAAGATALLLAVVTGVLVLHVLAEPQRAAISACEAAVITVADPDLTDFRLSDLAARDLLANARSDEPILFHENGSWAYVDPADLDAVNHLVAVYQDLVYRNSDTLTDTFIVTGTLRLGGNSQRIDCRVSLTRGHVYGPVDVTVKF